MKRSIVAAVGLALAVLAGCSSSPTENGSTTATTSVVVDTTMSSASEPSSPSVSSAPSEASAPSSEPAGSASAGSSSEGTTTAGSAVTGSLDSQSAAWFSTFCESLGDLGDTAPNAQKSVADLAANPQKVHEVGTYLTTTGAKLTGAAKMLGGMPAPTLSGGDTMAASVIQALELMGQTYTAQGEKLSGLDPSDKQAVFAALSGVQAELKATRDKTSKLGEAFTFAPDLDKQISELPSCRKIGS